MSKELLKTEKAIIDKLCDNFNFEIEEIKHDTQIFGNEMIILKSDNIKLRFVKDRGDIYIEINRIGFKEWYSIENILELVGAYKNLTPNKSIEINELNDLILKNLNKIKLALSTENMNSIHNRLKDIEKRKTEEMFGEQC
jgi:hypothetical protein